MTPESREEAVLGAVEERRVQVNDAIEAELPIAEPERLYRASRQPLDAGGKRLRPAMLLLAAESLVGEDADTDYRAFPALDEGTVDVMSAAVSVEVIHSFTLIHDDIMDDDDMRRGEPAVHRTYDDATAILAGDTLYSKAFEIMLQTGAAPERVIESLRLLASTCTRICEGQAWDVCFEGRTDVGVDEYLDMVERKTAVLYAAAASLPPVLLGADEETVDALYDYGISVGKAFQIQDDLLDLTVPSEQLGKRRGSDLVADKETVITLHAREQGVDVDGLVDAERIGDTTEAEIEAAVAELEDAGSLEFARTLARDLVAEGKEHLRTVPENESRETLELLADYLIERGY